MLDWSHAGRDWPNRAASRFVSAGGVRWHVQVAGSGPRVLLVHGTGSATHTWRGLLPLLAEHFTVLAPDLPGHAFSGRLPKGQMSVEGMAAAVSALLGRLEFAPQIAVGHSAGAAIVTALALSGDLRPHLLVSLNGAILHLSRMPRFLYSPLAALLAASPLVPGLLARRAADPRAVARLIASTGSNIDSEGIELYARLVKDPDHIANVLDMMAHWDLRPVARALPQLDLPLHLVVGTSDSTVPPTEAERVRQLVRHAEIVRQPGLGHLAHEEQPAATARLLLEFAQAAGLSAAAVADAAADPP